MDESVSRPVKKRIGFQWVFTTIVGILALIGLGVGAYYYNQYQNIQSVIKNPNAAVEQQTNAVVAQVRKLMVLPTNEMPTVATVTDTSKLKSQVFFQNAANGDKVLIYIKARKAILYDPAKNVIVDVAPLNITENQPQETVPVSPTVTLHPTPTVAYPLPTKPAVSTTPTK